MKVAEMNFPVLVILVFIVLSILIIGSFMFFVLRNDFSNDTGGNGGDNGGDDEEPQAIECQDFDCLAEASEDCELANFLHNVVSYELFGVNSTSITSYEIQGEESNKCVFFIDIESFEIEYSDALILSMIELGYTEEQVLEMERKDNENAETGNITCKFNEENLTTMLIRWEQEEFSSDDLTKEDCDSDTFTLPSGEEPECLFSEDCNDGFHCLGGECVNNEAITSKANCVDNVCSEVCGNCTKGGYVCLRSSEEILDNKCVECFLDRHCKENYECKEYSCVEVTV